ncbi:MAG TPA: Gldg family protein [Polyangiaceae bacterium]|jgi:hypothetical protein
MAVKEPAQEGAPREPAPPARPARPPPLWVVPLYLVGLVLLFAGQRVLSTFEVASAALSALGVLAVAAATLTRFSPRLRAGGERREIENLLAGASLLGVVGLLVYFLTTETGGRWIGLSHAEFETRQRLEKLLTVVWVGMLGMATVPMVFAEAALFPMRYAERPESRRVRAAALSGLTLALAAVYLSLLVFAAGGAQLKVDYSYFKTSRPSEATRRIAASFREPVRIVAFFPDVNEVRNEVARYLSELSKGLPNIKVEIQDRLLAPKLAQEMFASQDGVIALIRGESKERLVVGATLDEAKPRLKSLDKDFQEHLMKMVRSQRIAYFTVGHGEINDGPRSTRMQVRTADIVKVLLRKQNYQVNELGLAQGLAGDVPENADVVFVLGPSEPFAPEELKALQRYAARGGRLFLALDPDAPSREQMDVVTGAGSGAAPLANAMAASSAKPSAAPAAKAVLSAAARENKSPVAVPLGAPEIVSSGSNELAKLVGLKFSPVTLANEERHVRHAFNDSDRTLLYSTTFSSHASVSTVSRHSPRAAVVLAGAGSLESAPGSSAKVDFAMKSMSGTFADNNRNYRLDADAEKVSVFNLAAAVTMPISGGKPAPKPEGSPKPGDKKQAAKPKEPMAPEMRAFVTSDSDGFSDLIMGSWITNQVFFVDAVRWLGEEESFTGAVNTEEDVRIEHTKQADLLWFYTTIYGAPALVLGLGIMLSRRARRDVGGKR